MKVDVHVADAVVPARVQIVNDPVTPVCDRPTVPVGVTKAPVEVSVTVTVQVDPWFTTTGVVQPTVADVVLSGTVVMEMIDEPALDAWEASPGYEAVIWSCLGAGPVGVYVIEHVAEAVVPESTQEPLKLKVPAVEFVVSANVPVGEMKVPSEVSVTVTLHVEACPALTGDEQEIVVVVVRLFTVMVAVPLLTAWEESPG